MDGLHKLIEMLEKRFGKFWADVLLLITVLGAAAWGIHALFAYLIEPATRVVVAAITYFRGGPIAVTRTQAIIYSIEGILILLNGVWIAYLAKWLRLSFGTEAAYLKQQARELDTLLDRAIGYLTEHTAQMDRETEGARAAALEVDNIVREARAFSDKTFAELHTLVALVKTDSVEMIEQAKVGVTQILDEAEARVRFAAPSPQSPPGTEPEKQP